MMKLSLNGKPKKRKKKSSYVGKLKNAEIKAIKKPLTLFASRFKPETTEDNIQDFLKQNLSCTEISCVKLKTRKEFYASFKITIIGAEMKQAFNMDIWPDGILVKKFYSPRNIGVQQTKS